MKSVSPELAAHLDGEATTLCNLWEITRTDGFVVRLTSLDMDVTFQGNVFLSQRGFTRTAVSASEGLDPDTLELQTLFSSDLISREDVQADLYRDADVRIYVVNYLDLSQGALRLRRGKISDAVSGPSGRVDIEMQSLASLLQTDIVEKTSPTCRVNLGSTRCKVPTDPPLRADSTVYVEGQFIKVATAAGTGSEVYENIIYECTTGGTSDAAPPTYNSSAGATTADGTAVFTAREAWTRHAVVDTSSVVASNKVFAITVDETRSVDDAWFQFGAIKFEGGENQNLVREIKSFDQSTGTVTVFLPLKAAPADGDVLTIVPGCDKLRSTCVNKWAIVGSRDFNNGNVFNFQGEPDLPGRDAVLTYPDAQ